MYTNTHAETQVSSNVSPALILEDTEYLLITGGLCVDPVLAMPVIHIQGVSALSLSVLKRHVGSVQTL